MATFIRWTFWLLSFIPSTWAVAIGRGFARVMIFCNVDSHRISKINVDHCFVDKSAAERKQIVFNSLAQTALLPIEFAHLLHRPIEQLMSRINTVQGEDLLREAWAEGNGVLMLMPHFGCWEFMSLYLGSDYSVSALYTPPNLAALEPTILRARERQGATLFPTSAAGLRGLVRGMKAGHVVVLLPDQVPTGETGGIMSKFFDREALTMSLARRIAKVGKPKIIMACAWREIDTKGINYNISFELPEAGISSQEDEIYAAALNNSVQKIVEKDFAQYQWSYKRFRRLGLDKEDIYRRQ
ncbi:MAG: KDO2-lipid IV(A) lauroyltransferase [Candidatus Azotimanducaceae bacterium]